MAISVVVIVVVGIVVVDVDVVVVVVIGASRASWVWGRWCIASWCDRRVLLCSVESPGAAAVAEVPGYVCLWAIGARIFVD